jgi:hypothetical protein
MRLDANVISSSTLSTILHYGFLSSTTMIRCPSPHFRLCVVAILHALLVICSVYCPVAAWGPPPAASSRSPPISLASLEIEASSRDSSSSSSKGQENRKGFLLKSVNSCLSGLFLASTQEVAAAETIGKDPDCDDLTCLGVWDGLLAGE